MPDFYHDNQGYLQPPGLHEADAEVIHEHFVLPYADSISRLSLFNGWKRYLNEFSKEVTPAFRQWIAGSYITQKPNPQDIDVVNFVPADELKFSSDRFTDEYGSKQEFGVDGRNIPVYPPDNPFHLLTKMKTDHWENFFTNEKTRGILEIEINNVAP